jgi:hypothetical protein
MDWMLIGKAILSDLSNPGVAETLPENLFVVVGAYGARTNYHISSDFIERYSVQPFHPVY